MHLRKFFENLHTVMGILAFFEQFVLQQSVLLSRFNLETLRFCSNVLTNFSNCILSLQVKSADVFYVTSYDSVAVFSISC